MHLPEHLSILLFGIFGGIKKWDKGEKLGLHH